MGLFDWMKGKRAEPATKPSTAQRKASADVRPESAQAGAPGLALVPSSKPAAAPVPGAVQESEQTAGGLDFASAIQAHRNWKVRLAKYLGNESEEKLDYRVICRDDQCVLGKWINGRGASDFGHLPSFGALKVSHGQFHLAAGRIVQMHDDQLTDDAQQMLKHGDYSRYSIKVMGLLSTLYVEVADTQPRAA
ncbi:CZB domain-containing protein [Diaphorobacter caeni]|uniref:CZB domain-containing protein n=1 Tax=Diaphorobacter caeni TaxID=2784387 RepID=UPI00188E2CBA|nr:CZB domain-containing protein [Diaphorobacter caeni]MBF5004388.1 CZB domain-containing protein [Diaphorobacter caeni]